MWSYDWPDGRKFAFTIVDDTDNSTLENVRPLYDLLDELGFRSTKTVWVYPQRTKGPYGECLIADPLYRQWAKSLQDKGFEIALHGVGSGAFERQEILDGLEKFKEIFDHYPVMHVNHESNPDNLYMSPSARFPFPFSWTYSLITLINKYRYKQKTNFSGENPNSPYFWGDFVKEHIKYIRGVTYSATNTLAADPAMPYRIPSRQKFSNYWFSSSDAFDVQSFLALLEPTKIDQLEAAGGACIVYTHFGYQFVVDGVVKPEVEARLRYLAAKPGWFVPASPLLDHLNQHKQDKPVGGAYLFARAWDWHVQRLTQFIKFRH